MAEVDMFELVWMLFAIIVVGKWLVRNGWGRTSLSNCAMPDNSLSETDMIVAMLIFLAAYIIPAFFISMESPFLRQAIVSSAIKLAAFVILLRLFILRLKNGLKSYCGKSILSNIMYAFAYSVIALAITSIVNIITIYACDLAGHSYIEKHVFLEKVFGDEPRINEIVLLYFSAGVVAPLYEELLFRGFFQNILSKITGKSWSAIFITAIFFAIIHGAKQHWPALFVLGSFFGYSMVKTRSIVVPVIMHSIFNCCTITYVMLSEMSK